MSGPLLSPRVVVIAGEIYVRIYADGGFVQHELSDLAALMLVADVANALANRRVCRS